MTEFLTRRGSRPDSCTFLPGDAQTHNIHSTVQDKICAALLFAVVCHAGVPILGQKCEASNLVRQLKEPVCEGTLIGKICRPLQALLAERSLSVGYFCIAEYGV